MAPDEQVSLLGGTRSVLKISKRSAGNFADRFKYRIIFIRPISLQKQTAISLNLTRLLAGFFCLVQPHSGKTTKPCF